MDRIRPIHRNEGSDLSFGHTDQADELTILSSGPWAASVAPTLGRTFPGWS